MNNLNLFQKFIEEEQIRQSIPLSYTLTLILQFYEYSIGQEFNLSDKQRSKKKPKKKSLPHQELIKAFGTLSRQQKVEYYIRILGYIRNFIRDIFQSPAIQGSNLINDTGYSRSFNIKRWKEKIFRLDPERHMLFAEKEARIRAYDLKDYLLRLSKNKEYYSFVLEAINNNPDEKTRTVHIGFNKKEIFYKWFAAIKSSIEYREWEYYLNIFKEKNSKFQQRSHVDDLKFMTKSVYFSEEIDQSLKKNGSRKKSDNYEEDFLSKSMVVQSNKRIPIDIDDLDLSIDQSISTRNNFIPKQKDFSNGNKQNQVQKAILEQKIRVMEQKNDIPLKTYVDELIEGDIFEEPDVFYDKIEEEDEKAKEGKKNLDLFHKMYPQYQLESIQLFTNYSTIYEEVGFKIYQNQQFKKLKMVLSFEKANFNIEQIVSMVSKVQSLKELNENIQEIEIKTNIPSQNSALIYMILKPFNRLYRSRDFVFIRHLFKSKGIIYMIDKSIENTNYPPFLTIVRGKLCIVYAIIEKSDTFELMMEIQLTNEGYLNPVQQLNLTLKFLKAFKPLASANIPINTYKMFDLNWDISQNKANMFQDQMRQNKKKLNQLKFQDITIDNKNFSKKSPYHDSNANKQFSKQKKQQSNPHQQDFKREQMNMSNPNASRKAEVRRFSVSNMQQIGQIKLDTSKNIKNIASSNKVVRQLDSKGFIILDNSCINKRHLLVPMDKSIAPLQYLSSENGHPIWKNEWLHDDKQGGIIFIHKKKIEDQKGVLKFIISKIAKNVISGQSILNISLPVDIFSPESNLQKYITSMCYAPLLLQGLEDQSPVHKLVKTVCFGVTNSVLYISMQKPFNPIIGETFQCWINGCPAYAEQVSHHPPIGALLLKGRGYQVDAKLQSKMSLGVNSGTGINEGVFRVKFNDGTQVCFGTPGGEVTGLIHGDRKLNLVGKSYYWIANSNIVLQLIFDPFKKGFFSMGKKQQPSDYFCGTIWQVKPQFMAKFTTGKRRQPDEKERVKELGRVSGRWNRSVYFNNKEIFSFANQYPLTFQYQQTPLPSDSNWRQDIEYRRRNQIPRAQTQKQRMQVLQRKDRKLRQKGQKKK